MSRNHKPSDVTLVQRLTRCEIVRGHRDSSQQTHPVMRATPGIDEVKNSRNIVDPVLLSTSFG
jgi:hypothetical protein